MFFIALDCLRMIKKLAKASYPQPMHAHIRQLGSKDFKPFFLK